ncbi:MAG: NAD(P)-dependent oxidoreductase [Pseudomonadota bacterium]
MAKIGFIGAGKMGSGVVLNLCGAGHSVRVLMRANRQYESELSAAGASISTDINSCFKDQDFVFVCLASMTAWQEVFAALESSGDANTIVVDLTTAQPGTTAKAASTLRERGIGLIDAPMLKGPPAARAATLHLLVGGAANDIEQAMPVLRTISEAQHLTGASGTGHALKLINNAVTLTNSAIVYEAFALAASMGIDLPLAYTAMRESAAGSKRLDAIAPILISGQHLPSFDVATALKDLELYNEMAREEGTISLVGSGAQSIYRLGTLFGLSDLPVTQLGEMLFALNTGSIDNIGLPGTILKSYQAKEKEPRHA